MNHPSYQTQQQQMNQPYIYNLTAHPYPINQPLKTIPCCQQPQAYPTMTQHQFMQLRSHENFMKEHSQSLQEQIRYHENAIMSLREQKRREQAESRNMSPMNTFGSIESYQPIRRNKEIPVGKHIYQRYQRDSNSSFASKYPQI